MGFWRAPAGSNHTSFFPASWPCSSPTEIWALSSEMKSKALLAMRAFSARLSLASQLATWLGSYTGYPFSLFVCVWDLYPHNRDQMKCLPAFSTNSLRSSSSVWLSLLGWDFVSPQYPVEHMVIKTINAAIYRHFINFVVNYDNGIHTQKLTWISVLAL